MKATNVLLYHLAMSCCTTLSSETLDKSKVESSQVVEEKAPVDAGLFLKIKQEFDISVEDTEFEDSYFQNKMRLNRGLSKLNERKDLIFGKKLDLINNFIEAHPKDKEFISKPNPLTQSVDDLCNRLGHSEAIKSFFQNVRADLRFLNAVTCQGQKMRLFLRSNALELPHSIVSGDLVTLLHESRSKLGGVNVEEKNQLTRKEIQNALFSFEEAIISSIREINSVTKLMDEFIRKYDGKITEELFGLPEFKQFFSDLTEANNQFQENFRKYAAEYKKLRGMDDEKMKEFLKENYKIIYYISSAFEAVASMNAFLINLQSFHTKQAEVSPWYYNIKPAFYSIGGKLKNLGRTPKPPKNDPADYILTDLASNLAIYLLDNNDAIFQQLEAGNFSVPIKTAADQKPKTANPEDAAVKPKESQGNRNQPKAVNGKTPEESKNISIFPSGNIFLKFTIVASILVIITSLLGIFAIIWLFSLLEKFIIGN